MPTDDDVFEPPEDGSEEFVSAVVARSPEEAQRYRDLLEDHGIPALIEAENEGAGAEPPVPRSLRQGIPVLVPEALLDEASEVIADRENLDEFELAEEEDQEDEEEDDDELGMGQIEEADDLEPAEFEEDDELDEEDAFEDEEENDAPDEDDEDDDLYLGDLDEDREEPEH